MLNIVCVCHNGMGTSMLLGFLIAIVLGLYSGKNKNGVLDKITSMFCYVGISIPTFWFGIMLIYLFSVQLHILPSIGMHSDGNRSLGDLILHMVMPCAVLTFANASQYIRYLRSSTITEMSSDYVMVKKENFQDALEVLAAAGYEIVD